MHSDVFSSPQYPLLFSVVMGMGFQIILMSISTLLWAFVISFHDLAGLFMMLFPYFGYVNGFLSAKCYRLFNGSSWKLIAVCSVLFYPAILFTFYKTVYKLDEEVASDGFGDISTFTFAFLTVFINLPSTATGTYHGFIGDKIEFPTKQNRMRRDIPEHSRNIQRICLFILSGLVPFIVISVQFTQLSAVFKQIIETRKLQRRHN